MDIDKIIEKLEDSTLSSDERAAVLADTPPLSITLPEAEWAAVLASAWAGLQLARALGNDEPLTEVAVDRLMLAVTGAVDDRARG